MKSWIQRWGITSYILILSAHLYAQILGDTYQQVQVVTKLLLLPLLILILFVQDGFTKAPKWKWLLIIALLGSFIGDAFLLSETYFIPGMIAFMTTHIFNILFFNSVHTIGQEKSPKFKGFMILLFVFCCLIFIQLKAAMGVLIYPILLYMALICSAALMAIHAGGNVRASLISKLFWFPGMLFFITSDTVLAFNKFSWEKTGPHLQHIGLVTMLTYGIAQLFLVKGFNLFLKQFEKENI